MSNATRNDVSPFLPGQYGVRSSLLEHCVSLRLIAKIWPVLIRPRFVDIFGGVDPAGIPVHLKALPANHAECGRFYLSHVTPFSKIKLSSAIAILHPPELWNSHLRESVEFFLWTLQQISADAVSRGVARVTVVYTPYG